MQKDTKPKVLSTNRLIKNCDLFGYPITLNFDGKGDTHQTIGGGLISIIICILFFLMFVNKIMILAWDRTVDLITSYEIERGKMDPINMSSSSPLIFAYLLETSGENFLQMGKEKGHYKDYFNDEVKRRVRIEFSTLDGSKLVEARRCEESDFGD